MKDAGGFRISLTQLRDKFAGSDFLTYYEKIYDATRCFTSEGRVALSDGEMQHISSACMGLVIGPAAALMASLSVLFPKISAPGYVARFIRSTGLVISLVNTREWKGFIIKKLGKS